MPRLDRIKKAAGAACLLSLEGTILTSREAALFREMTPIGVIFFKRNIESLRSLELLCGDLRRECESLCIFAIDEEGGRVRRLPDGPYSLPPAKELAILDEEIFTERVGTLGRELRRLGLTMDMAPVVDLRSGEDCSIVGDRAFSDDPVAVTHCARRYLAALQREGIAGVIKHFPGHGATTIDSHKELPRIEWPYDDLAARDLVPYQLLADTASFVMAAHILVPAVDPLFPASLSREWMRILREEIGFGGFVMSDDLEMHALDGWTPEEKARLCLEAGSDLILVCSGREEALLRHWEGVVRAAEADDILLRRLEQRGEELEATIAAIVGPIR